MRESEEEREVIRAYFAQEAPDDPVVHVEKAAIERVGSVPHDIWDVHTESGRWWAVTNPLNLYSQDDFKSRDVVLTFHVGLALRMASRNEVPIADAAAALLPDAWERWGNAIDALGVARAPEDFQAVGMRLRECLTTYVGAIADDELVPKGQEAPKKADVVGWTNRLLDQLAQGSSAAQLRSYTKKLVRETWDYVNWLTHARNAIHRDAEIGAAAVSHFLASITAVRMRWGDLGHDRCRQCGSYSMEAGHCPRCGWTDENYGRLGGPGPAPRRCPLDWPSRASRPPISRPS